MIKWFKWCAFLPVMAFAHSHYEVFVDLYASPFMGSELMLTLHKALEEREDGVIPPKDPPRKGVMPSLGRAAELGFFWIPLNSFTDVVQHEVFGHGYRIRSSGGGKVLSYSFDWPAPYGAGGGATSWAVYSTATVGELQAVNLAGLEAENILARNLKLKWLTDGVIDPRAASLYNNAELASLLYSLIPICELDSSEDDEPIPFFQAHDIAAYLTTLDVMYPDDILKRKQLQKKLLYNVLDPMLYYGIAASWYYIFTGKSLNIPMIHIGDLSWLPNVSVQLAPYGLEYYIENYFLYNKTPIYTYLKGGSHSAMDYFGAGIHYDEMFSAANFSIGVRCDGWYQPDFLANWTVVELLDGVRPSSTISAFLTNKWGASASIVSRWRIRDTLTFFYSDLGYKTKGYLPGFPLQNSPIVRLGISAEF